MDVTKKTGYYCSWLNLYGMHSMIECYLDLHNNCISEPEFSIWLDSLRTTEGLAELQSALSKETHPIQVVN
jgi:hypothetical protein